MKCRKCTYKEEKPIKMYGSILCRICATFAPSEISAFQDYVSEKADWKTLETFRKHGHIPGRKQKEAMSKKAKKGLVMHRAPLGYDLVEGKLIKNEESAKVHTLFVTFTTKDHTLSSLAQTFSLSLNGIKKVLTNRTYLGETKFAGNIHKGKHEAIIEPSLFYTAQKKIKENYKI